MSRTLTPRAATATPLPLWGQLCLPALALLGTGSSSLPVVAPVLAAMAAALLSHL